MKRQDMILPTTKKGFSLRRVTGLLFGFVGSLMLASYISFLLFDIYPIFPTINFIPFWGTTVVSPAFGIHIFAVLSFILLFISSLFLLKSDRVVLNKLISIAIDGLALLLCMYILQSIFVKGSGNIKKEYDFSAYLIEYDIFKYKIIAWSLFLSTYYLFGEFAGGTFGKKIARLITQSHNGDKISLKQVIQKAVFYAIPIWVVLLMILLMGKEYPFRPGTPAITINETTIYHVCQWVNFGILFLSLLTIFVSAKNNSLAEIFSNSTVALMKKQKHLSMEEPIIKTQEVSETVANNISTLHELIAKEKKKIMSGKNESITDLIRKLIFDRSSFNIVNNIYKTRYSKDLIKHLTSISSNYETIHFYIEPLIEIGVCEEKFPYKIVVS